MGASESRVPKRIDFCSEGNEYVFVKEPKNNAEDIEL